MVGRYYNLTNHKIVEGLVFNGRSCLKELDEFTGCRPFSINQIDEDQPEVVTCCISVQYVPGYAISKVVVPGSFVYRGEDNLPYVVAPRLFEQQFRLMEDD